MPTDRVFPDELEQLPIWVCWARDSKGRKRPRAPWLDGHCYPVGWGSDADRRPETDFETARKYARLRGFELEAMGLDFEPDIPSKDLEPGLILPHDPADVFDREDGLRIVQIDLDDVRDPETGDLHPVAGEIAVRADTYGSISVSGEGIHLIVWGRLPDGYGKFIADLDDEPFADHDEPPQLEIYDHGRHVALTGKHLPPSPLEIRESPELVDELIDEYEEEAEDDADDDQITQPAPTPSSGGSGSSPYYDEPLTNFALPSDNVEERTHEVQGAHPVHGGTSSSDSESSNYNIDKRKNQWHCFAHGTGGGPLKMVAVMEGKLRCADCTAGVLDRLDDDDFLEVCLAARDLGFDGPPPYRALVELARQQGLALKDPEEGVLGRSAYAVAKELFEKI